MSVWPKKVSISPARHFEAVELSEVEKGEAGKRLSQLRFSVGYVGYNENSDDVLGDRGYCCSMDVLHVSNKDLFSTYKSES